MKNILYICFLAATLISSSSVQAFSDPFLGSGKNREEQKIFVNNRILTIVNGKPITTFDLMKKMDLSFYRQYPEYTSSIVARKQYYDMSWKYVLNDIIDKELILADAQESKIELSSGDIRQEIEASFGPNIIINLDKAGITYEEASKIMQDELTMRRMISGRVHAKAIRQVTPNKVKQAYDEFTQDPTNARLTQWAYRIITVKERDLQKTEETAQKVYRLLLQGIPPDQMTATLKEQKLLGRKGKITLSKVIKQNDKEISEEVKNILSNLDTGMYSQPFVQKSRTNQSTVYRIVIIDEKTPGGLPPFREMEGKLKDKLLDEVIEKETILYLLKLRQHYHVKPDSTETFPIDYKPFMLK